MHDLRNLYSEERWYRVSNLFVLLSAVAAEDIVIRERLKSRGFSRCHASTLQRVIVDVVVAILRDVTDNRSRRLVAELNPETISKVVMTKRLAHVSMVRVQRIRKV